MWSGVLEMMLKMVRMVMLGFSVGVGGGDAGRKQSEPSAEGSEFRGSIHGGGCVLTRNLDFSLWSARGEGELGPAGEIWCESGSFCT